MMKKTTLCYIENNGAYLMMFRGSKPDDPNAGKWIGVGGKLEEGETPLQCVKREVLEETGLSISSFTYHGIIHFRSDEWEDEDMYLYSTLITDRVCIDEDYSGEGTLKWIDRNLISSLPMWEGDKVFLDKLASGKTGIEITLKYRGKKLVEVIELDTGFPYCP